MSVTVNVVGQSAVSVSVAASTSVSVVASGGIGPAGFITVPGTATLAFGTFQFVPGDGITVSTANGQFLISSYPSTSVSSLAPVQSVAGRTGTIVLQASDVTAGTFAIGRIPTIGYTALSGVPTAFTPSAHTHSTTDVVAFTAAASAAAPVQSVQSRTGAVVLTRADITAAAEVHTHSTADVVGLTAAFSQVGHTHDAAAVTSGTLDIARIPTIGYTALSGTPSSFAPGAHTHSTTDIVAFTASASAAAPVQSVAGRTGAISLAAVDIAGLASVASSGSYTSLSNVPATFPPVTHTHSTTDIAGYEGLPAQAGYAGPLVTDGTNATWTSRYSIVSPVLVQGAGMTLTRDTSAGSITVAFAGGTSGLAVGSLTPLALGVAAAGSSSNASREDHVHKLPTVGDITAAAAIHTHDAAAIASGTIDAARLPATVSALNALTGGITIAGGANVTVSTASSTITIAAGGGGGSANIVEAATAASFPGTGSAGTLYHAIDVKRIYFWDASGVYVEAGPSGGGSSNAVLAASAAAFPATGTVGRLYVATTPRTISYWSGSEYITLGVSLLASPTALTATGGNAQALLQWESPAGAITGYSVQYSTNSGSTWATLDIAITAENIADEFVVVYGLTNETAYVFRVAAVNGAGRGEYSSASNAVTPSV